MPKRTAALMLRPVELPPPSVRVAPSPRWGSRLRRLGGIAALVLLSVVGMVPRAAAAEPGDPDEPPPIVFEGGTRELRDQLDLTQTAWLDAKVALDASVARQQELATTLADVQVQIAAQTEELGKVSRVAYVSSGQTAAASIISGNVSVESMLDGMGLVDALATRETNLIQALLDTRAQAREAQAGIDQEIARQNELLAEMEARKQQAQLALCRVAAGCPAEVDGAFSAEASYVAVAAPRNADGSWPAEYIPRDRSGYPAVQELTITGNRWATGYITPRTAHMLEQSMDAGFGLFVGCYGDDGGGGEHPRGRACDFAVEEPCIYCGAAVGAQKAYGDSLAAFLVFNAERLGVLYVIWYRQIWIASTGRWKSYSGAYGDSSSDHTNHVHVSMR